MTQGAPAQGHGQEKGKEAAKPRRKGGSGMLLMLVLVLVAAIAVVVLGLLSPLQLAFPQQQILGLIHGGIADVQDKTIVDCDAQGGETGPSSRQQRTIVFNDNTSLVITFASSPTGNALQCGGS